MATVEQGFFAVRKLVHLWANPEVGLDQMRWDEHQNEWPKADAIIRKLTPQQRAKVASLLLDIGAMRHETWRDYLRPHPLPKPKRWNDDIRWAISHPQSREAINLHIFVSDRTDDRMRALFRWVQNAGLAAMLLAIAPRAHHSDSYVFKLRGFDPQTGFDFDDPDDEHEPEAREQGAQLGSMAMLDALRRNIIHPISFRAVANPYYGRWTDWGWQHNAALAFQIQFRDYDDWLWWKMRFSQKL